MVSCVVVFFVEPVGRRSVFSASENYALGFWTEVGSPEKHENADHLKIDHPKF